MDVCRSEGPPRRITGKKATFPILSLHPVFNLLMGNVSLLGITWVPGKTGKVQAFFPFPSSQRAGHPTAKRLCPRDSQTSVRLPSGHFAEHPARATPSPAHLCPSLLFHPPPKTHFTDPFLHHSHVEIHISKINFNFLSPFLRATQN